MSLSSSAGRLAEFRDDAVAFIERAGDNEGALEAFLGALRRWDGCY
jgi:hypothetical protein